MNATSPPPFPLNPAVGQIFGQWVWNGSRWVSTAATGVQVITTVFQVAGSYPYQPSPGLISLVVEAQGGGGAGGAALGALVATTGMDNWMCAGGGGAAGCYARKTLPAALVLGGVVCNVGAGGVANPTAVQGSQAGSGNTTSFGAFCTANGGGGGWSNVYSGGALDPNYGRGGQRGTGTDTTPGIGDIAVWGDAGISGNTFFFNGQVAAGAIIWGGYGGGSHFQSSPPQSHQNPAGVPGVAGEFGSGGGGGASGYANGPALGANGGDGLIIITEYCWGDAGDVVCCDPNTLNVNARVAVSQGTWDGSPCQPSGRGGPPAGFAGRFNPYGFGE